MSSPAVARMSSDDISRSAKSPARRDFADDDRSTSEYSLHSDGPSETSSPAEDGSDSGDYSFLIHDPLDEMSERELRETFLFNDTAPIKRKDRDAHSELIFSLDQLAAKDLGAHLYNAFKLKKRALLINKDDDIEGPVKTIARFPPKTWTAWPLPPNLVPRGDGDKQWTEGRPLPHPYLPKPEFPGNGLREMLAAQILRKAKRRLQDRGWESEGSDTPILKDGQIQLPGPTPMIDDEKAKEFLCPSLHHVMTRFDDLLRGLHCAMSTTLSAPLSAESSRSQTNERSLSKPRTKKRGRSGARAAVSTENSSDSEGSDGKTARRSSTSAKKRKKSFSRAAALLNFNRKKRKLGLRDWSEVLGVASLTGVESATVEKAAVRCSEIFDEGMLFRTLGAGVDEQEMSYLGSRVTSNVGADQSHSSTGRSSSSSSQNTNDELHGGVHVDGFLQPIEGKKSWSRSKRLVRTPKVKKASPE